MGICLTGIIEIRREEDQVVLPAKGEEPEYVVRLKPWDAVATIEYNKDYPMMRVARALGIKGMPPDPSWEVEREAEWVTCWLDGERFKFIAKEMLDPTSSIAENLPGEEPDQPTLQHRATEAFVDTLLAAGAKVRVVFTEC